VSPPHHTPLEGEKWSATNWIHIRPFEKRTTKWNTSEECADENWLYPK